VTNINVQCVFEPLGFVYVTNRADNTVSSYLVQPDGTLIASGPPTPTGRAPSGVNGNTSLFFTGGPATLYVTNATDSSLATYTLDTNSGVPTLSGTITSGGLNAPNFLLNTLENLYVTNGTTPGTVSQFDVQTNELAPNPVPGGPVPTGNQPVAGTFADPEVTGQECLSFFYFASTGDDLIRVYTGDPNTGALSPSLNGNQVQYTAATGPTPSSLAALTDNVVASPPTYVYAANSGDGTIYSYVPNCLSGALTKTSSVTAGGGLNSLATLDIPNGEDDQYFLYATTTLGIVGYEASIHIPGVPFLALSGSPVGGAVPAGATPGPLATYIPDINGPAFDYSVAFAVPVTANSNMVTLMTAMPTVVPGMRVAENDAGTSIPTGTYVVAVNGQQVTLSNNATTTGTVELYFTSTFVYSVDTSTGSIYAFRVNASTGQLTAIGTPVPTGRAPSAIFVTPRPNLIDD
jgi:hypothetical protein